MIISIDPGINGCGMACFVGGGLAKAHYVKTIAEDKHAPIAVRAFAMAKAVFPTSISPGDDTLVLEYPQIYRGRRANNPNDLLTLALVDGMIAGLFGKTPVCYLPHAWKGSVNPDVCVERVKVSLSASETPRVVPCAKSLQHNVWDAIGIGLFHLGRFNLRRVYER